MSETDDKFRILVDSIVDYAVYMLDQHGLVTSWNAGAERIKGYSAQEIIGESFAKFYTEEDRAGGMPQRVLATAAREGRFEGEGWRVRKDGTRFWAHVILDAVRSPSGAVVGFAKVTRDLTEPRAAGEALRRSEDRFRLLVQGVTDYALYMLDPSGHIASWNQGAERIKGYTSEEIIGQHFSLFYTDEDRAVDLPAHALRIAEAEGRYEREGWRVRKDGTRFWASVVIDPVRDDEGRLIGFAKITRDITERTEAQRTLEATRERLFHAQKMEALGGLTGGVAHDFNNLLSAVLGSLDIARKSISDPKVLRLVDNAIAGAQRGAKLTQRMLAFARRQELKLETVDLPDLVRNMDELFRMSTGSAVDVETSFPIPVEGIRADPNQLEMALLNLVVNARDAMPSGGTISITAKPETVVAGPRQPLPAGRYVCLSVTDPGVGMDETTLARAVEPFFTTKGPGKGSGLGLSVVHGVAEQLGGRFVLRSKKGKGTTAELWLPVADAARGKSREHNPNTQRTSPPRQLFVLAVDDDPIVLFNTEAMLEDLGHRVISASSGQTALEILHRERGIDLVITDQLMPRMTGTQLAKEIRREWPKLPVLLATGYAEVPAEDGHALPRLSKPFTQPELTAAILKLVPQNAKEGVVVRMRNGNGGH